MIYQLINTETQEVLTQGDDNTVHFGGPWGQLQSEGKAVWVEYVEPFAVVKAKKIAEIDEWTKAAIVGGFTSAATGANVKFDSDEATQSTMQTMYAASKSPDFETNPTYQGKIPIRGYAEGATEKAVFELTASQIQIFMDDIAMHIGKCKQIGWNLQAAVNDPNATAESIALIVWPA